ncbi:hypothetical protein CU254_39920 [Amycolatopsis sp. AA4]|nr:hypothetical protein CU254_39920 [Amycolatopsis sp. AA4]
MMSWQEELRRLDAELAAGRLGHAEHRRQRDELLAEASGGGAASPVASPLRQDSGSPTWSAPAPQATPGAESQQAPSAAAESSTPEAGTPQNIATMTGHGPFDGPMIARRVAPDGTALPSTPPGGAPAPEQPAAPFFSPPPSPAAPPSQATPPAPHQPQPQLPAQPGTWPGVAPVQWHPPGQQPNQQQPSQPVVGWASTNPAMPAPEPPAVEAFLNSAAAPAAEKTQPAFSHTPGTPFSTDRPTTAPSPADDRPTAVFGAIPANGAQPEPRRLWEDDAKPRRSRPTWLFLSLAVLVVLALVVGGIWFIGAKNDSNDTAAPPPAAASAPNTQPASLEDKLPTLPGTPNPENSTMALDKAVQAKAVSDADANLMRAAGADQLVYHSYGSPEGGTTLIAVPTPSKAQAGQLVQGLRQNLVTGGFDSSPFGPAATDLLYTGSSPAGRVLAFWYTSGGVSVGIGVSGPVGQDPAALRSRMEQIRAKVAAALPAS